VDIFAPSAFVVARRLAQQTPDQPSHNSRSSNVQ
jgi:hypothetical protein